MDFDKNTPIYLQIIDAIKEDIISAKIKPGDKMPSVREISRKLRVNPTTIQRAYKELEQMGFIYTERGMGSYVTKDNEMIEKMKMEMAFNLTNAYIEKMKHMGYEEETVMQILRNKWRGLND